MKSLKPVLRGYKKLSGLIQSETSLMSGSKLFQAILIPCGEVFENSTILCISSKMVNVTMNFP